MQAWEHAIERAVGHLEAAEKELTSEAQQVRTVLGQAWAQVARELRLGYHKSGTYKGIRTDLGRPVTDTKFSDEDDPAFSTSSTV